MPLIRATDKIIDLANGSVALSKLSQVASDVFTVVCGHDTTSITSAGTYRFGSVFTLSATTTAGDVARQVVIPFTGNLVAANISFNRSGTGSAGNFTMAINNQTAAVSTNIATNLDYFNNQSFNAIYSSFSPAFSVTANDVVAMNWIAPSLATYPTSVRHTVVLWFKRILA